MREGRDFYLKGFSCWVVGLKYMGPMEAQRNKKKKNRGPFGFFLLILQQRKLNLISVSVKKRRETCRDKDQGRLLCLQLKW